jgi:hypothetical protein
MWFTKSAYSRYAIFEIQDGGMIKMVFTSKNTDERDHSFDSRDEAIEWILINGDSFRRCFIMEQITVY